LLLNTLDKVLLNSLLFPPVPFVQSGPPSPCWKAVLFMRVFFFPRRLSFLPGPFFAPLFTSADTNSRVGWCGMRVRIPPNPFREPTFFLPSGSSISSAVRSPIIYDRPGPAFIVEACNYFCGLSLFSIPISPSLQLRQCLQETSDLFDLRVFPSDFQLGFKNFLSSEKIATPPPSAAFLDLLLPLDLLLARFVLYPPSDF